ncbi:MAG: hypothetical protein AB7T38_05845 [Nitrospirales bacterium]
MIRVVFLSVVGLIMMTGCSAFQTVPDLGNLYNKLAQQEDPLRNPGIVIPGIMGSRLENGSTMDPAFVDNILYFLLESPGLGVGCS